MKKIILSTLVVMFAAVVSAATYTWQNVVTLQLTDGNSDTYTSRFGEAPELTSEASWGAAVANLEGATVRAYTVLNGEKYEKLFLNDMTNTLLEVKTYNSTSLTFTLTANYGVATLYDKSDGTTLTVDKSGVLGAVSDSHTFTVPANTTIQDRFYIFYDVATFYSVTTNAYGWASYSNDVDLALPAGLTAYKGAISGEVLSLTPVADIAANQGVILYGAQSTTYYLIPTTSTADFTGNDIKPSSAWNGAADNIYCLKGDALYQYTGSEMPANKAYIQIAGSSAPQRIRMVINGAQGIEDVEAAVKAEKFVENGQIFIRRGEHVYDLQGQIVK